MADSESILQLGIEAARAGEKEEARDLFRLVTREDPSNPQGYLWLAGVAEDQDEKRAALEQALALDPDNDLARKGLLALSGEATTGAEIGGIHADANDSSQAGPTRARMYPSPSAGAIAGAAAGAGSRGLAAWSDDSYDLSDYQSQPTSGVVAGGGGGDPPEPPEDEPERRRPAWLIPLIGVLALLIIGAFLYSILSNRGQTVVQTPPAAATRTGAAGSQTGTAAGTKGPGATTAGAKGASATKAPAATAGGAAAKPGTTTSAASVLTPMPAGQTTIVIEGSGAPAAASTAGSAARATQAAAATAPAAEVTSAPATPPAASQPTAGPPAAPADVAAAHPTVVPPQQSITAGNWTLIWNYGFGPLKAVGTGTYAGVRANNGQWLAVTVALANTGGQPATIPDGWLVVKDSQNRVYEFNRAVSVDWFAKRGGRGAAADQPANEAFGNQSASTIVLFDVPPDATNLVLFSRDNAGQGYQIR